MRSILLTCSTCGVCMCAHAFMHACVRVSLIQLKLSPRDSLLITTCPLLCYRLALDKKLAMVRMPNLVLPRIFVGSRLINTCKLLLKTNEFCLICDHQSQADDVNFHLPLSCLPLKLPHELDQYR